jgi:hypothetical protein
LLEKARNLAGPRFFIGCGTLNRAARTVQLKYR